jgi:hypothetical protein
MNFELKVKDVLLETFIFTGKIKDNQLINNLINFVKNNKDNDLSNKTHVKGYTTGFQSLVNNKDFLNFLNIIKPEIKVIYNNNFSVRDAWGNLCKIGEQVTEHNHKSTTAFCGILYLTDGGPGTYFKEHDLLIEEEIGKYVLFHPFLKHSVKKIEKNIERITVAFNIAEIKEWEKKNEI